MHALPPEETRQRFYTDAMEKIPLRGIAGRFERIAKESTADRVRLERYLE